MEIFLLDDAGVVRARLAERAKNTETITELHAQIAKLLKSSEERQRFEAIRAARDPYIRSYLKALSLLLTQKDSPRARQVMITETLPLIKIYHAAVQDFVEFEGDEMVRQWERTSRHSAAARRVISLLLWAAVVIASVLGLAVTASIFSQTRKRRLAELALRASHEALENRVRQRTAELQDSAARYRLLFESNPQPMWVFDQETLAFLAVNAAASRHYGYSREEFLSMTIRDIRPEADVPALLSKLATERTDECDAGGWRHRTKDGRVIDVEIGWHPILFNGRQAQLILATDITERREAERMMVERTTCLNALVETSPIAILVLDPNHRVQIVNPAFVRLFGYSPEEVLERNPDDLIAPEDPELRAEAADFTRDCLSGRPIHSATTRRRKDGKLVEVELYGVPLVEGGRLLGVYAFYQDMTEKKELTDQLRQSQKIEAVGRLAGGIAHDFNNLLTVILGTTDLLLERTGERHPMYEDLKEVHAAGERAAGLTRQLLAFSRKQVLRPEILDVNNLLGGMERMLRRLISEDIELTTSFQTDLWSVRADPGQIEQAVLNLCVNARDAMPRGGQLRLKTENLNVDAAFASRHRGMRTGDYVQITVADTGVGMDGVVRSRLFEPFFTTKEQGKGTGLGLSMVYGIVKQSGGYVWAASEVGQGTVFRIHLPRAEAARGAAVEKPQATPRARGTETILLVEDEPEVRSLVKRVLQSQGYRVLVAERPSEAIEISSRSDVQLDLMVTDVVMPEMDGRELFRRLEPTRPSLPVLYLSGYTPEAILQRGILDSGTAFLQKPFRLDVFAQKVRETLDAAVAQ
jgi:PAS domain S-box-containing protein